MNRELLRALARVQQVVGRAFSAEIRLDPDLDEGDEPRDPHAYSRVPRHPRTPLRSGAVALAEPDDESQQAHDDREGPRTPGWDRRRIGT
jgi:hypothetical protein